MKRLLSILMTVLALTFFMPLTASADMHQLDYVSLGDSLAAGQPYNWYETGMVSGYGYSDILADRLEEEGVLGEYTKAGISGLRTVGVLRQLNSDPLLQYRISQAEIITLNIGANDLIPLGLWLQKGAGMTPMDTGFMEWVRSYPGKALSTDQLATMLTQPEAFKKIIEAELLQVGARLYGILSTLTATKAQVYVMGYYNALPDIPGGRELIEALNGVIKNVAEAEQIGATYVPTMTAFDKHLYRYLPLVDETYPIEGISRDIHPTIQGYRAIAQSFWIKIQKDFLRN